MSTKPSTASIEMGRSIKDVLDGKRSVSDVSLEAAEVAKALAFVLQLVDRAAYDELPGEPVAVRALEVMEAIIRGHDDPVWSFLDGVRAGKPGDYDPPTRQRLRRASVVALMDTIKGDKSQFSIAETVSKLSAAGVGVSADQIKGWNRRDERQKNKEMIAAYSALIAAGADRFSISHEEYALALVKEIWFRQSC